MLQPYVQVIQRWVVLFEQQNTDTLSDIVYIYLYISRTFLIYKKIQIYLS